jgi:ATP-dependent 26S proteasome regulatory subunit
MRQALDPAFLRRLRFIVQFPFPDAAHRADIWFRTFPDAAPTGALDYAQLAQLNLSGGHIRNVALAGAFIAADRGEPIGMNHLAEAARSEYMKLERTLTDAETRGWA